MKWADVRTAYPDRWLVIEALEAHSDDKHFRHLDKIAVIDQCADGSAAFDQVRQLHKQHPGREYYFVHTAREELEIEEVFNPGLRIRETRETR